jgi:phage terminase small subunit
MPDTADQRKHRPPRDLDKAGKALWRTITRENSFDAAEFALLHLLCRTIDVLERIALDLSDMGVVVAGSTGQPRVNPLLAEQREQIRVADQLVQALAIPVPGEAAGQRRSGAAKAVAKTRRPPKTNLNRVNHLIGGA